MTYLNKSKFTAEVDNSLLYLKVKKECLKGSKAPVKLTVNIDYPKSDSFLKLTQRCVKNALLKSTYTDK